MNPESLFLLLILLACPLMMVFMMRGGGHGGHGMHGMRNDQPGSADEQSANRIVSIDELRSQRKALDAEIATRQAADEASPKLPAGV